MLKETFKMRKIGKHLVNVSMLSLAIAPVVGSALAPVTVLAAEQTGRKVEKIPFKTETKEDPTLPKGEKKVIQKGVEGEKEIVTTTPTESQSSRKPVDVIVPYDVSGSTYGGTSELDHLEAVAKQGADDTRYLIIGYDEGNTPDGFALRKVVKGETDSQTKTSGARISKVTRFLSKQEILTFVKKVRELLPASHQDGSWSWDKAMKALNYYDPQYMEADGTSKDIGTPYEEIFEKGRDKNKAVGILWFTDDWEGWEKYDTSFFDWAQKNHADQFLTVVYGGTNSLSYNTLTKAGQKEILTTAGKDQTALAKEIADKFTKLVTITTPGKPVTTEKVIKEPVNEIIAIGTKLAEPKVTKRTEKIPFKTETKEDPTLPEGEKKVVQKGVEGEKEYVTTTLEDVAGQDGTAEGSVQFTTKASVTTSNEIKPRSIFAIIDNSGSVGGGNDPRIRSSFIPLLETMGPNDQIQIATYGVNQKESYFSNGADDRERMVTKMMNRDEFAKLAEEILASKTGTTREAILNQKLVYDFKGVKQSGSGYEFEDIFDTARNKDYTPVVMQFTDGWEYEEDIDHSFAEWSKAHAKTFMSVLYNTGRAEVAMKKAGHPNIFVAQGKFTKDSDQTKKVLDQIKATTTEVVKKGANQTVKVSIGGQGVTVTKATLKGAVNKELPIKDGKVEFSEALADGSYTLEYAAKGNGTLKSLVTVDGKEVGNKTVELKGTPGQKGESKTVENIIKQPVNEIIHIGTKGAKSDVIEKKVPFETIRKEDPTLEEGKEKVIQEGVEGVIKVTTTYDTQKGQKVEGSEKVTEKETVKKVDKIIAVGTKGSKSEVTEKKVPFETIKKDDPTLEEGQEKVVQEGVEGVIKVTTTYETQKGEKVKGSEKVTEEKVTDKVDKIIAVGTKGSKSEVTEKKVPFETIYKQDTTLKKGEEKVLQEGVEGVIKVTTTYETQKGKKVDGSEKVTEETVTEKVDKIVAQGTMEKRKVRYRVVDSKGQELVKQTDVMEAYQDEEYKVETPKLDGYRLELAKGSVPATGKVADRDVLVTFVAVKIGKPVTLKFIDESGSEIAEKKVLTGENAEVDTEFTGEAPETIEKDGIKYAFVGIKQTGSKERKVSGKVTDQEQVIEAVYAKPKELPKTSEQAKQRNTAIIALLSVVGLGGLATYLGLRKRDEK